VDHSALYDFNNGFTYDLGDYLHPGTNQIEFRLTNNGGPAGLIFRTSLHDRRLLFAYCCLGVILLGLVAVLLTGTPVDKGFTLIITGAFLIRLLYFLITAYDNRSHDVGGHMHYIEYLVNHCTIPPVHEGWQTYHPPLYYMVAALVYKLLNLVGISQSVQLWRWIQFLSLVFFIGFLMVIIPIIKNALGKLPHSPDHNNPNTGSESSHLTPGDPRLGLGYLAFAMIAFWPSGIIHSLRIGNDGLFYFFYALSLVYLIKWQDDNTPRNAYWSFILITLAFITKANAMVLYLVFGIIYGIKFYQDTKKQQYLARTAVLFLIFIAGFGITFGRMVEQRLNGSQEHFVVANASKLEGVTVGNKPLNYLSFSFREFLKEPYVHPFEDRGGRQYFWTYLFKTGLVGEFSYTPKLNAHLTVLMSVTLLLMLLYMLGSPLVFYRYLQGQLVLILNTVCLIIAAIGLRVSIPASCSNDFRYILPVLIPFGIFFACSIWFYRSQKWDWMEQTGYGLSLMFIVASIAFFLSLAISTV
ncbi:MAG TPA: hypothetical protein VEC37_06885, partial [Bacillota bacterium]|nr:hypothetical protein [Bacillota bacterium]